jgi:FMN phosphatase YigB (HAD superfamily)
MYPRAVCLQVYQLVMERIGATASNTIFIDDSPRNIAAAHELGIFTVSCTTAGELLITSGLRKPYVACPPMLTLLCFEELRVMRYGLQATVCLG